MIRKLLSGKFRLYSRKIDPKTGKRTEIASAAPQPASGAVSTASAAPAR